jgi:adenosylhomocysteine nucleosidase
VRDEQGAAHLVVVAALPEEIGAVRARLHRPRRIELVGVRAAWTGTLADLSVTLAVTGVGARSAEQGMRAVLARRPDPSLVVAMGFAGGLDPRLRPADLVLGARVLRAGGGMLRPDEALLAQACEVTGGIGGWVATADRVATAAAKRALGQGWLGRLSRDADPGPGVVDLESWWTVRSAEDLGARWIVARAISDCLDDELPPILGDGRAPQETLARGRVLLRAVRRPMHLPGLARLAWRARQCAQVLASAVERLAAMERGARLPLGRSRA